MKNMFQIVQPQRALYVQAGNCVEEKEWIDILTKICQTNSNRLEKYHPSAYINGHWLWLVVKEFLVLALFMFLILRIIIIISVVETLRKMRRVAAKFPQE